MAHRIALALGILSIFAIAALNNSQAKYRFAMNGVTPISWTNKILNPDQFKKDHRLGNEDYSRSLFFWIYPAAAKLGVGPETFIHVVITFEYALLAAAIVFLFTTLFPNAPPALGLGIALMFLMPSFRSFNFARFGHPVFIGQQYEIVEALRFFAIAFLLRGRLYGFTISSALAFCFHPILGVFLAVVCIPIVFNKFYQDFKKGNWGRWLAPNGLFLIVTLGWFFWAFDSTDLGAEMPTDIWFAITGAINNHWYPMHWGALTLRHHEYVIPHLAILLLAATFALRSLNSDHSKLFYGVLLLIIPCILGFYFSEAETSVALVKMSLHRASDFLLALCTVYVFGAIFNQLLKEDHPFRLALYLTILLACLQKLPFVFAFLVAIPGIVLGVKRFSRETIVPAIFLVSLGVIAIYAIGFEIKLSQVPAYLGHWAIWQIFAGALLVTFAIRHFKKNSAMLASLVPSLFIVACIAVPSFYSVSWNLKRVTDGTFKNQTSVDFLEAQLWARDNTPKDSLFLVDPTIAYGWRDYSQRSSFGSMREWLQTSWIYYSKAWIFEECARKAALFGYDVRAEISNESKRHRVRLRLILDRASDTLYQSPPNQIAELAKTNQIDYGVLYRDKVPPESNWNTVHQNDTFLIVRF